MTSNIPQKLGKRLQELRKINNLTQSQFAEMVGVEVMTISRIENGSQYPKPETLEKFSKVLNIEIKDLFSFESCKTKEELMEKINRMLRNSTIQDLKFYNNLILNHIEYKNYNKIRQRKISV